MARWSWVRIAGAAVAVAVLTGAGVVAWRFFGGGEPAEVALTSSSPVATGGVVPEEEPGDDGGASIDVEGTWTIDTQAGSVEDGSASFAGYRIEEEVSGIGSRTAVGRTPDVEGSMQVTGTSVTALTVTVDTTTLRSDDERRDDQLADRGLETAAFPTATFVLAEPIVVGSIPAEGEVVDAVAVGDLTLHGVTNRVDFPIEAQRSGDRIEVAGSLEVALADYAIEPPTGFLVLSIADTGTIELHLVFAKG